MRYFVPILALLFFSQTIFSKIGFTKNDPLSKFEVFTKATKAFILYDAAGTTIKPKW